MTTNWQCQTCGLCMTGSFVGEHKWLAGHKKITKKSVDKVAEDIIFSFNSIPKFTISIEE
jgi:hypothetical protein